MGKPTWGKTSPVVFPKPLCPNPINRLPSAARLIQYKHKKYKAKKETNKTKKRNR